VAAAVVATAARALFTTLSRATRQTVHATLVDEMRAIRMQDEYTVGARNPRLRVGDPRSWKADPIAGKSPRIPRKGHHPRLSAHRSVAARATLVPGKTFRRRGRTFSAKVFHRKRFPAAAAFVAFPSTSFPWAKHRVVTCI
jgi:hypothetical protein